MYSICLYLLFFVPPPFPLCVSIGLFMPGFTSSIELRLGISQLERDFERFFFPPSASARPSAQFPDVWNRHNARLKFAAAAAAAAAAVLSISRISRLLGLSRSVGGGSGVALSPSPSVSQRTYLCV